MCFILERCRKKSAQSSDGDSSAESGSDNEKSTPSKGKARNLIHFILFLLQKIILKSFIAIKISSEQLREPYIFNFKVPGIY